MPFKEGTSGNEAGRPKGTQNKTASKLRQVITDFLENRFEDVVADFQQLEPNQKIKVYTDLLQYAVPKLQSTTIQNDLQNDLEWLTDDELENLANKVLDHINQ